MVDSYVVLCTLCIWCKFFLCTLCLLLFVGFSDLQRLKTATMFLINVTVLPLWVSYGGDVDGGYINLVLRIHTRSLILPSATSLDMVVCTLMVCSKKFIILMFYLLKFFMHLLHNIYNVSLVVLHSMPWFNTMTIQNGLLGLNEWCTCSLEVLQVFSCNRIGQIVGLNKKIRIYYWVG